ncbi:MAG TPA: hypothetical protein VM100_01360 [Longimicrobiales bacterium]|nr:hypothetical protein [Longimicrobiales bacterium]
MLFAAQLIAGFLFGFGAMMLVPVPQGWELVVGVAGISAGVIGASAILRQRPKPRQIVAAIVGATIGAIAIVLLPPLGFRAVLIPVVVAVAAYHSLAINKGKRKQ